MSARNDIFSGGSNINDRYVPDYNRLKEVVDALKVLGYKIVLTQGVFDLPHVAHFRYLEKAREQGDILVVGVDSDEMTKKRKGPGRPIVDEEERIEMLLHIRHVDIISLRDTTKGINALLETIHPDVLVVSESTKEVDEERKKKWAKHCEQLVVLPPQAPPSEKSTTARIRQILLTGLQDTEKEIMSAFEKLRNNLGA